MNLKKKLWVSFIIMSFSFAAAHAAGVVIEAAKQQINVDKNKGFFWKLFNK